MVTKITVPKIPKNGGTLPTVTPAPHPFVELDDCAAAAKAWDEANPNQKATIACTALPVEIDPAV